MSIVKVYRDTDEHITIACRRKLKKLKRKKFIVEFDIQLLLENFVGGLIKDYEVIAIISTGRMPKYNNFLFIPTNKNHKINFKQSEIKLKFNYNSGYNGFGVKCKSYMVFNNKSEYVKWKLTT